MRKILIFGNSGSGKSTLARKLCSADVLSHLDLDILAWMPTVPPERKPLADSKPEILDFISVNRDWVIEGGYTDLLNIALPFSNKMIFMNLPVELCVANALSRPWEPHKYKSKEAQDNNLEMLIAWISKYPERADTFSEAAHKALYEQYTGAKRTVTINE